MKIGMIHTLYGRRAGLELYVEKIISGMIDKYDDLSLIVYGNAELLRTLEDHDRITKAYIPLLDNQIKKAFWLEFLAKPIVDTAGLDVFWIPSGTSAFPGHWRAKTIVTFHDFGEYFIKGKYDAIRMFYRKYLCVPLAIRRAETITVVSKRTARDLATIFPKAPPAEVIYSGANPRKRLPDDLSPIKIIKKETGVSLQTILFTPGRTDFIGKGLDILLQAYKEMRSRIAQTPPLIMVGPQGEEHERFINEIKRLGLEGSVHWLGRVSDRCVDALYSICELVIIASRFEGFGFPLLEAMEHHKPVVCSNAGAIEEVVGDAGYVFKSGDADSLLSAMITVYTDRNVAEELVSRGRFRVALFNWERTYESMRRVFAEASGKE